MHEMRNPSAAQGLIVFSVIWLVSAGPASAAMFNASNVAELIAAINAANQNAEPDSIALAAGTTFTLTAVNNGTGITSTGLPTVTATESLTILGNGGIIERSSAAGTPRFRLFDVSAGAALTLEDLTLQGGLTFGVWEGGAAIHNLGALALADVTVQNNIADGLPGSHCIHCGGGGVPARGGPGRFAVGGGIYSSGSLLLENSSLLNNQASGGNGGLGPDGRGRGGDGRGGGLYVASGTATLLGSIVTGNHAQHGDGGYLGQGVSGGVYIADALVALDDFTLAHVTVNTASTSHPNIFGPFNVIPNVTPLPGDYNSDGAVDAADYVVVRKNFSSDQTKYNAWRANFGTSLGAGSGAVLPSVQPLSAVVPEPVTAVLLMIGVMIPMRCRVRLAADRRFLLIRERLTNANHCNYWNSLGGAGFLTLAIGASLTLPNLTWAANYSFSNVADISGPFSGFHGLSINDSGTVAFVASLDVGGAGIFTGSGGGPTSMVVDDSGPFSDFGNLILPSGVSINNGGQVAFFASLDAGGWGIFSSSGGPVTTIADTNGPVSSFAGGGGGPSINDGGTVAFVAGLDAGTAAVLTGNGGPLTTIADSSGPGSFSLILGIHPSINNGGTVAFVANFDGGGSVERGIFTSSGGPATLIVDGSGSLSSNGFAFPPAINDRGHVAYHAQFDTAGGETGIFIGAGTTIADSSGLFSRSFGNKPAINNRGTVAFNALLDAGGVGIFTGPDPIADKVIRTGDSLFGSTVASVGFWGELNDNGDIPFSYGLANGSFGIAVAQRLPNVPVPSAIPQQELRAEASVEYRANTMAGFTASDLDTAGIPGRAEALASHPNFPTNTAFGQAYAEVPVVPVTTDDLGKVGSRSYAESPLPGFPGGPIDSPTRASAEARQIIKLMVPPGIAQPVDIDMTVHFDGSLQQKVVPGVVVCETPCDPAPRPGPGAQVTTSVSAEVNTYHSAGKLTPFEASAILDWNSGGALKLRADGDWATHWTALVQPSGSDPGGSSVSYTEFFDDMFFLASNDDYTVEVVLRTEVFNHFVSTRLGFVSIADFFNSGAVTFSTDTPGVTIVLVPDGLAGDFTRDGVVDAADYVVGRISDGTPENFNTWRTHFGETAGVGSSSGTIPEPATILLLLLTATGRFMKRS